MTVEVELPDQLPAARQESPAQEAAGKGVLGYVHEASRYQQGGPIAVVIAVDPPVQIAPGGWNAEHHGSPRSSIRERRGNGSITLHAAIAVVC